MTYDTNNIFAKILRGEIPCLKIYEDEHTLAFMDVMPHVEGHCLVIPKVGSRNLLDAELSTLTPLMATVQRWRGPPRLPSRRMACKSGNTMNLQQDRRFSTCIFTSCR